MENMTPTTVSTVTEKDRKYMERYSTTEEAEIHKAIFLHSTTTSSCFLLQ
jgi:hypothetical protein